MSQATQHVAKNAARQLARVVRVDEIAPIRKADLLELARVGGWRAVVKKDVFQAGALAVYFEIDSFLPAGNPAWDFLVDKHPTEFQGQRGHALRTVTLRGQLSQGLLLPLSDFPQLGQVAQGEDVTERLGVLKFERELSDDLKEFARGYYPTVVPRTTQPRIQNLEEQLDAWRAADPELTWEVTEKLEGESTSYIWLEGELHVCSHSIDYLETSNLPIWHVARRLGLEEKLRALGRSLALQGELVGPGVAGNHYNLREHQFYLYDVYDHEAGRYLKPTERHELGDTLGLPHVPVLSLNQRITPATTMDSLLKVADGASLLNPAKRREGLVYKANETEGVAEVNNGEDSFKVISNSYLLGVPLTPTESAHAQAILAVNKVTMSPAQARKVHDEAMGLPDVAVMAGSKLAAGRTAV